jgi:hypothetical protein
MPEEKPGSSQVILYQTEDGKTRVETRFAGETAWLSLNQMAELFQRDKSILSKHIRNIFAEGELRAEATVAEFATVQTEGERKVSRDIEFYNLDLIISVGYRVKSHRGTQFRIWATLRLREYPERSWTPSIASSPPILDSPNSRRGGAVVALHFAMRWCHRPTRE